MMHESQIEEAAQCLAKARRKSFQIRSLPAGCVPGTVDEAYAIQDRLAELLGLDIAGWFLGCTNDEALARLGAKGPYSARLFSKDLFSSPAAFPHDHFFSVWVDCEFAFRLRHDLEPSHREYSRSQVLDAVTSVHPAIEIVNGYLEDWQHQPIGAIMADNGTDGALIVADGLSPSDALDLASIEVTLYVNDKIVEHGCGANVLGDPWQTLTWLANEQSRRGFGLKAGHINNTGSCTVPVRAQPGDRIVADYQHLGAVQLSIEHAI